MFMAAKQTTKEMPSFLLLLLVFCHFSYSFPLTYALLCVFSLTLLLSIIFLFLPCIAYQINFLCWYSCFKLNNCLVFESTVTVILHYNEETRVNISTYLQLLTLQCHLIYLEVHLHVSRYHLKCTQFLKLSFCLFAFIFLLCSAILLGLCREWPTPTIFRPVFYLFIYLFVCFLLSTYTCV